MKKAFSLLEIIFAIVVIGIITSVAVPKYINTKNSALASTLKRDLVSTANAVQSYYIVNRKLDNIQDAITINGTNWDLETNKISYTDDELCVELFVEEKQLHIKTYNNAGDVCEILKSMGIEDTDIDLI